MSKKKQDLLEVAERLFYEHGFRGVGLIEDYSDTDNNIEAIARGHKERLLTYLENLANRSNFKNGRDLAIRYTLLMEGTTSMTTLLGVDEATKHARYVAHLFIDEATKYN